MVTKQFSKSQIDRLGERLKKGKIEEDDLRMLDQYRRAFTPAYEVVVKAIRAQLSLEPTGRPAKSTPSIVEKLRRESIRLTQIQDIAGCRLIATDIANQHEVVDAISGLFDDVTIVDRREKPSHGYRAVHVIVKVQERLIEIQVRTMLQHLWAELSEKLSDVFGQTIKYGGGREEIREALALSSRVVCEVEGKERNFAKLQEIQRTIQVLKSEIQEYNAKTHSLKLEIQSLLRVQPSNVEIPKHDLQELSRLDESLDHQTKGLVLVNQELDLLENERLSIEEQVKDERQRVESALRKLLDVAEKRKRRNECQ
jgi:ppGpp synthetase/RelA/SpoT-type nucleotidyltranferase